jgi:nucleoside-diphosphate kinase
LGPILQEILQAGFEITALHALILNRANAEEFLEVYKVGASPQQAASALPTPMPGLAQGVLPEYTSLVTEMESGICVALEIASRRGEDAHQRFREYCGPHGKSARGGGGGSKAAALPFRGHQLRPRQAERRLRGAAIADPEIARHLRSHTLRAKFGSSKVQNAIHCTDLPDDCALETEYFFNLLLEWRGRHFGAAPPKGQRASQRCAGLSLRLALANRIS